MEPSIHIDGLTKDYGNFRALDQLDLDVMPGEIFGFLGPNGAGKSTTIRLLIDLIRPTSGRASILGFDCQRQSQEVRSVIGYLPGDLHLYPDMSGRETVQFFAGLRTQPVDIHYVNELAGLLELDLERRVSTYSKGNRQKVGIVIAMLSRPSVLLLDEPTSGLDPLLQVTVWNLLRAEAERGTTVFFSSHVMSEVEEVCERVAILRNGKLAAVEPVSEITRRAARRFEVTFAEPVSPASFVLTQGRVVSSRDRVITFDITGEVDNLLKQLAQHTVVDLRTEEPTLEDALMTFYQDDPS